MSRESHQKFLEQSACRTVRRAQARDAGKTLRREAACKLRMQTVEPWKRIVCLIIGAFFLAVSWMIQRDDGNIWAVLFLGALGLSAMLLGTFGHEKPIDAVLNATGDSFVNGLFDAF
jgi:hypothetical protein